MLLSLFIYLLFGALSGLVAGLFGVGGGAVIVPILLYAFALQGMSVDVLTHMAIGTSLAIICFTSVSSVLAHHKNGFVIWSYLRYLVPGLLLGVVIGVYTAVHIPGPVLQWIIGGFLFLVALKMLVEVKPQGQKERPRPMVLLSAGGVIGWASALFGIGGGSLTVPFLNFYHTKMQQAVATSAACGVPIAVAGALSNVVAGSTVEGLPQWSLGFIYLPALVGMAVASVPCAKVGANLAKRLPALLLKRIFAVFLMLVSLSIVIKASGVFL